MRPSVDDYTTVGTPTAIPSTAAQIIENFQVPSGRSTITYAQSLGFLRNLPRLRALAGEGKFDYYAQSSANDGSTFLIEKGLVIITISGS